MSSLLSSASPRALLLAPFVLPLLWACAPPARDVDSGGGAGDGGATDGGATDGGTSDGGTSDGGTSDGGADGGGTGDGGTDGGTGVAEPTVRILFPQTRDDVVICPEFVIVVDVEGMELVDFRENPDNVEGQGHWHLFDSGDYLAAYVDDWGLVTLENDGSVESHILTVELAQNDHTELGISATTEILVGPDDCIGGAPSKSTDGGGTDSGGTDSGGTDSGSSHASHFTGAGR
ncbi:hypothetical protein L6R53_00435 [Myxococcota bacterium]|nr:hypothetical protein [Myxococcota bacterium]